MWRAVRQQHAHHLRDQRSGAISGNQSQSQHRKPRHRQDGEVDLFLFSKVTRLPRTGTVLSDWFHCSWLHIFIKCSLLFFRTTQISSTLTCGRPSSRGEVCLHLRRAHLLLLLKARPSCWTPIHLCSKCCLFKVWKWLLNVCFYRPTLYKKWIMLDAVFVKMQNLENCCRIR